MPKIRFQAKLTAIGSQTILRLPGRPPQLPSRGLSMVEGPLNGHAFQAPLEPDGVGEPLAQGQQHPCLKAARAEVGDSVSVALEPMARWPEPKVPADLAEALASDPQVRRLWLDVTPRRAGIGSAGSARPETATPARSG